MKEANYKDTQITLIEAVLVPCLSLILDMFLFAGTFLQTKIIGILKNRSV